jgi:hypothetical protein
MNVFYLHHDPKICARQHVDRHVVKMIVEYAQLLSTAHRLLDGKEVSVLSKSGRRRTAWQLPDGRDDVLYKATHMNHPSAKWVRDRSANYRWLAKLWAECLKEYTFRYGKVHSCERLAPFLSKPPTNIKRGAFAPPWRAMPDEYKVSKDVEDYAIKSYRAYYNGAKTRLFSWKRRGKPAWAK